MKISPLQSAIIPVFDHDIAGTIPNEAREFFSKHGFVSFANVRCSAEACKILELVTGCSRTGVSTNDIQIVDSSVLPSASSSDVPWHQEDYHLQNRPAFLAFRCLNPGQHGEGTRVLKCMDVLNRLELQSFRSLDYEIRFARIRDTQWTQWFPLGDVFPDCAGLRYAQPDPRFRKVEVRSKFGGVLCPEVVGAIEESLSAVNVYVFSSQKMELLVLNNFAVLHSRPQLSGDSPRHLERYIVHS